MNLRVMARKEKKSKDFKKENEEQPQKSSDLLHKKLRHIPVVVVGIIGGSLLIASVAGLILSFSTGDEAEVETTSVNSTYPESGQTYRERAEQLAYYGNYDAAQTVLDEGASLTEEGSNEQGEFYFRKAYISLNAGEFEDALVFAETAESILKTVGSATFVAEAAEANNDNLKALDYWTLAAERTPEEERNPDSLSGDYGYVLFRIKELGGTYEP